MGLTLLTGGVRAGKSRLAAEMAGSSEEAVHVLATAEARDDEMRERIAKHRAERPPDWKVIEAPLEMGPAIDLVPEEGCLIIDCLTLWVSNLIEAEDEDARILARAVEVGEQVAARPGRTIAVTNEVGWGIVPLDPLARRYRDLLGEVNSLWAARAERSFLVVAGRALELKEPV